MQLSVLIALIAAEFGNPPAAQFAFYDIRAAMKTLHSTFA